MIYGAACSRFCAKSWLSRCLDIKVENFLHRAAQFRCNIWGNFIHSNALIFCAELVTKKGFYLKECRFGFLSLLMQMNFISIRNGFSRGVFESQCDVTRILARVFHRSHWTFVRDGRAYYINSTEFNWIKAVKSCAVISLCRKLTRIVTVTVICVLINCELSRLNCEINCVWRTMENEANYNNLKHLKLFRGFPKKRSWRYHMTMRIFVNFSIF